MIRCPALQSHLPKLLPFAFDDSDAGAKPARLNVAVGAIIELLDSVVTEAVAKKVADWTIGELQALGIRQLLSLLNAVLDNLAVALRLPIAPRSFHLLPTILSVLSVLDAFPATTMGDGKSVVTDGESVTAYALATILRTPWAGSSLVPLATMLRDINLPEHARSALVAKLTSRLAELEPTQMPALVYQLLLLADTQGKPTVLHALNTCFEVAEGEQWLLVQGTVILHVQFAVKQDQNLGTAILKQAKAGQLPLGRFSFALLLSLARVGERFHDQAIQYLASAIREAYELRSWTGASAWLAQATAELTTLSPDMLLASTVRTSGTASFDHLVPSLIDLAGALLDVPPPNSKFSKESEGGGGGLASADGPADGADAGGEDGGEGGGGMESSMPLLPVAQRMALCGRTALLELFRLHTMVRPTVIDRIIDRLIGRGSAASNWVSALDELVRAQPLAVLDHVHRIRQLLEYVLALPPSVATAMLTSLLPLQRQKPELRDHLVLLLRKAMFSREEPMRLTAVHGFLLLLHTTNASHVSVAGGALTAAPSEAANASRSLHFQLELLGFIRRSLTQQAAIRRALYMGIVPAFAEQPHLRPMIFELLMGQLANYTDIYESDDTSTAALRSTPLRIDRCITFSTHDNSTTLVEPLPQLIHAITQCMQAQMADGDSGGGDEDGGEGNGSQGGIATGKLAAVRARMRLLIDRLGACELKHFGLHSEHVLTGKDKNAHHNFANSTFLAATLEALLDHTLLCHAGLDDGAGGQGDADGPIYLATQADATAAPSQMMAAPFGANDPGVRAARKLFIIGSTVRDVVNNNKVKGLKPLTSWLSFDLSLEACRRVLAALHSEVAPAAASQGSQQKAATSSKRFARHVLKGIAARAATISASLTAGVDGSAGVGVGATASTLETAGRVLSLLLELSPQCEEMIGKESVSGHRNAYVNPLTGQMEKSTMAAEKSKGGKGAKGDGTSAAAKAAEKTPSRLLLLLHALDKVVALFAAHAPSESLAAALASSVKAVAVSVAGRSKEAERDEEEGDMAAARCEGEDGGGGGDGDGGGILQALMNVLLPMVQRLIGKQSYMEAEAALSIAGRLSALLPAPCLRQPLEWTSSEACLRNDQVDQASTAKALLTYHLATSRRAPSSGSGANLVSLCQYTLAVLGDNFKEEEMVAADRARRTGSYALISEGKASSLSGALVDAITVEIVSLERALVIRKRYAAKPLPSAPQPPTDAVAEAEEDDFAGKGEGGDSDSGVAALERAMCAREKLVIEAVRLLVKAQLDSAHTHPLLTRCARIFKHQLMLWRWLPALPALAGAKPRLPTVYKRLVEQLCGDESLCSAMYGMIAYVGSTAQTTKTAALAKKEAKIIPEVVFAVDKFEAEVVKVGSKAKMDLLKLMKRATARDFRIQVNDVTTKLKMLEQRRRQDEAEKAEKEGKKRKREADKADGKAGGSKIGSKAGSKGVTSKAKAAKGSGSKETVAAPLPVEEEEEGEEEGEEDMDEYPASMVDDEEEADDE